VSRGPDAESRPARVEPPVTDASAPFWDATREQVLSLPWCLDCGEPFWFPREVCPKCLGSAIEWRPASGRGVVYAVTVENKPMMLRAVFGDERYAIALVELDEGVRMMTNVVGCPVDEITVGQPVGVTWEPMSDGRHLALFTPRGGDETSQV
jgi:uncharacterized protein